MSPEEVIALIAALAGAIAIVGMLVRLAGRFLAFQERKLEILAGQTAEKAAQYASQNRQIEERLRVVERIVTDESHDVARRIEALRADDSPVPANDSTPNMVLR